MKSAVKIIIALFFLLQIFQTGSLYPQYVADFRVNDDIGNAYQGLAALDVDITGNFVVVWFDQRNVGPFTNYGDIYCQRFNKYGLPQGNNFKINIRDSIASFPAIATRKDGSFVVVFKEIGYKMRIYNSQGIPISSIITVNDSIQTFSTTRARVSIDLFNNIIVTLRYQLDNVWTYPYVYFQKFDSIGNKLGNNEKVIDNNDSSLINDWPDIKINNDRSYLITWEDSRIANQQQGNGPPNIFMQMYNSSGQKIGMNRKVNDDNHPKPPHYRSSVSSDSTGRFTITWLDSRETLGSDFLVYSQNYNSDGSLNGTNYRVDQGLVYDRNNPKVRMRPDGYYVIGWYDRIYGPMFQRFNNNNQSIGEQKSISLQNNPNEKIFQDIAIAGDRVISIWQDYRNGNYDIYCNIRSFNNPDSIISSVTTLSNEIPSEFKLFQNYPNPFNPRTLPNSQYTILKVYDALGNEVATLVNQKLDAGSYSIEFDATNLSSGVYFYKFETDGFVDTKKMYLVK